MRTERLKISGLGPIGDGIAKPGPVFVDRSAPGDTVLARIQRDPKGIRRGEVVQILSPSPYRQQPPCPHYDNCGNCTLQHLRMDFYHQWKTETVEGHLRRQGITPKRWHKTISVGEQARRRVTFTALKLSRQRVLLGYYKRRSDQITQIPECLVAHPRLMKLHSKLKFSLSEILQTGVKTDFFLQFSEEAMDLLITGPLGASRNLDSSQRGNLRQLADSLGISRVSWRLDYKRNPEIIYQNQPITAQFAGLKVTLPPGAFLQPTQLGEEAIAQAVLSALPEKGVFADLFSGCGSFSGRLLERGRVDAYEIEESAVRTLTEARHGNLRAFRRNLYKKPLTPKELNRYDGLVFDPPRAGCPELCEQIAQSRVKTVVGVSCNPLTFARDAGILAQGGYRLTSLQIIDQFHWSHHIELVGVFKRR